jgi:hypothetical protein
MKDIHLVENLGLEMQLSNVFGKEQVDDRLRKKNTPLILRKIMEIIDYY